MDELCQIEADEILTRSGRKICDRCRYVTRLCICDAFPTKQISICDGRVYLVMIQHPAEQGTFLNTVRILGQVVQMESMSARAVKSLGPLQKYIDAPDKYNIVVLFPHKDAKHVRDYMPLEEKCDKKLVIIVLDGTWNSVRNLYNWSPLLKQYPSVSFQPDYVDTQYYKIRKEPHRGCMSTIEAVAECAYHLGDVRTADAILKPFHRFMDLNVPLKPVEHLHQPPT